MLLDFHDLVCLCVFVRAPSNLLSSVCVCVCVCVGTTSLFSNPLLGEMEARRGRGGKEKMQSPLIVTPFPSFL